MGSVSSYASPSSRAPSVPSNVIIVGFGPMASYGPKSYMCHVSSIAASNTISNVLLPRSLTLYFHCTSCECASVEPIRSDIAVKRTVLKNFFMRMVYELILKCAVMQSVSQF